MDLLRTILIYLSMLFISSVQIAPDPSTVHVTPSPEPTLYAVVETATPAPTATATPVPTPALTPNPAYGQLVMGDRNDTVTEAQQKLAELGYYTGEIDGAYGNQTRHAVELFQYQNGLTVDGIAGKYTLTVLFESDEVVAAPENLVATNTPVFALDETAPPPPATEMPEVSETPAVTATPEPTETPPPGSPAEPTAGPQETAVPEETEAPEPTANLSQPILMEDYTFVRSGFTDPLTAQDTETVLHPVELEEILYVPLTEILQDAGNVIIENADGNTQEVAFSVLTDFYQASYTLNEDGSLSDLVWEKNAEPQPLTTRNAILMEDIFYLPLEDVQRITGITFAMDDTTKTITITMPSA